MGDHDANMAKIAMIAKMAIVDSRQVRKLPERRRYFYVHVKSVTVMDRNLAENCCVGFADCGRAVLSYLVVSIGQKELFVTREGTP